MEPKTRKPSLSIEEDSGLGKAFLAINAVMNMWNTQWKVMVPIKWDYGIRTKLSNTWPPNTKRNNEQFSGIN